MDIYNDTFMEYLITRKKDAKDWTIIALLILAGVIFSVLMLVLMLFMVMSGYGTMGTPLGLLAIGFAWYGIHLLISMRSIEYEYILTNSEMDIDKVMSRRGRKHLISWDFKNIEICAAVDDTEHKSEYENTASRNKILDLTGDKTRGNIYFADFDSENGDRVRVLFQPTSKMIETARKYNMRKIFVK